MIYVQLFKLRFDSIRFDSFISYIICTLPAELSVATLRYATNDRMLMTLESNAFLTYTHMDIEDERMPSPGRSHVGP